VLQQPERAQGFLRPLGNYYRCPFPERLAGAVAPATLLVVAAFARLASRAVASAVTTVAAAVTTAAVAGLRSRSALRANLVQVDLAARVDLGDHHFDLVADVEVVLDLLDPLAIADLGDVQQAITAWQQRDERSEGGGLDDRAQELVADLRHRRVGDGVDPLHRGGRGRTVGGADVDGAVVLDRD